MQESIDRVKLRGSYNTRLSSNRTMCLEKTVQNSEARSRHMGCEVSVS